MARLTLMAALLCLGCGDSTEPTPNPKADIAQPTPDSALPPQADAMPPDPDTTAPTSAPLYVALTVHLEGWSVMDEALFTQYVKKIREYSDLTHQYQMPFTWETANLTKGVEKHGDNILLELQAERGDGVGVHADLGGSQKPGFDQAKFMADMQKQKTGMEALGVEVRHVSGICSHLDWVTAAREVGYEATTATVEYCLKSLPEDQQSPEILACDNPSKCHDPYPSDPAEKLHAWRAESGSNWTTPSEEGLILFHSSGSLPCLAESAADPDSHTNCTWDQDDVDQAITHIETALSLRDPSKMNQLVFVWSFGQAINKDLLKQLLEGIQTHVDSGNVVWTTLPGMIDHFEAWEQANRP